MLIEIILDKEFTDITERVKKFIKKQQLGVGNGVVVINVLHTTVGLKVLENEILSLSDLDDFLNRVVPSTIPYAHDKIYLREVPLTERINGASHVKMLFFNSALTLPIINGELLLGTWQSIIAAEMDFNPTDLRKRTFIIQVIPINEN